MMVMKKKRSGEAETKKINLKKDTTHACTREMSACHLVLCLSRLGSFVVVLGFYDFDMESVAIYLYMHINNTKPIDWLGQNRRSSPKMRRKK